MRTLMGFPCSRLTMMHDKMIIIGSCLANDLVSLDNPCCQQVRMVKVDFDIHHKCIQKIGYRNDQRNALKYFLGKIALHETILEKKVTLTKKGRGVDS